MGLGLSLSFISTAAAQGCSDAGFCTLGALKPNQVLSKKNNLRLRSLEISQSVAYYDRLDVTYSLSLVDFNFSLGEKNAFQIKLPYQIAMGPLATAQGLNDISLSYTRTLLSNERQQLSITLGTKIPTGDGNVTKNGLSLPMFYQPSLGTYDLIAGVSWVNQNWHFAFGYQQALNENNNQFNWGIWQAAPEADDVRKYPVSRNLMRGLDLMLRVEKSFQFANWSFFTGFLPIYRFTRDVITSPQTGERVEVAGSEGLVVNWLIGFGYRLNIHSTFKLSFARRLYRDRDIQPDGLARIQLLTVGYQFNF